MTDEELAAIEALADAHVAEPLAEHAAQLVAEIRRLHEVERRHDALYAHFRDVHAALGEWDDKELTAAGSVRRLVANVERLRAAIDDMRPGAGEQCLWCSRRGHVEPHAADCSAFEPDGSVK